MPTLVEQLYLGAWATSVRKAATLVAPEDAGTLAVELLLSPGWRERVVAAKIACAYQLRDVVPTLVRTFARNPENYTAVAFARLLACVPVPDASALLKEMQSACPSTEYGRHLLKVIDHAYSGAEV